MKLNEALKQLNEIVDDREIASEITKLLGFFEIRYKKIKKDMGGPGQSAGGEGVLSGWKEARRAINDIAKKEYKGVKTFK